MLSEFCPDSTQIIGLLFDSAWVGIRQRVSLDAGTDPPAKAGKPSGHDKTMIALGEKSSAGTDSTSTASTVGG